MFVINSLSFQLLYIVNKKEAMEKSHFVLSHVKSTVKQEFIPEELTLSDENIVKKEFTAEECQFRAEYVLLLENAEIKTEDTGKGLESIISDADLIIKDELLIEDSQYEDISRVHSSSGITTVIKVEETPEEISHKTSISNQLECQTTGTLPLQQLSQDLCLRNESPKKYSCNVCKKVFRRAGTVSTHKLMHSGTKRYKCDVCNKAFFQSSGLYMHKLYHSGVKNHQCEICSKCFAVSSALKQHKLIHSGIKMYQCDVCNKTFASSGQLVSHKLIHNNVQKHKCNICNTSFSKFIYLVRHKLIHSCIKN